MKIKTIEIRDFRGISNVTIDNLDKNLNLLIGVNGAGKSSVLEAIALILEPYTARLTKKTGYGRSIKVTDIKKYSRRGCTIKIILDDNASTSWYRYKSKSMEDDEKSAYTQLVDLTKPQRISLDNNEQIEVPTLIHYGVNRAVTGMMLPPRSKAYSHNEEGKPTDAYTNWYNQGAIFRDFLLWFKEKNHEELIKREIDIDYHDRGLQAIRDAMKVIFPDYSDIKMASASEIAIKKDNEELLLDQLSDGEKCYIALVCDIARRMSIANPKGNVLKGEGIVLIDEVDLHLHPSWEANVMEKLRIVFPNVQFIVSAHSPLVASHFDGQVYGVMNGNVESFPRLHGLDYSTILMEYMGVRPDNREVSSLVEMYRSYSRHNMTGQADAVYKRLLKLMHGDENAAVFKTLKK